MEGSRPTLGPVFWKPAEVYLVAPATDAYGGGGMGHLLYTLTGTD